MNNIQKYRGIKNISQKELAAQLGMSKGGLSYVENNHARVGDMKRLTKISEILGVSVIKLLGEENFKVIPNTQEDVDFLIEILEKIKENL